MKVSPTKTICFFNSNKAWGGGEKWHLTTCKEFQRRGHHSILVANEPSEMAKKGILEGQNVYRFRLGNLSFLNPIKLIIFYFFFKLKKVDTVILNLPSDLKAAGIGAKLAGVKKIIYRRGMPLPLRNTFLNRFLFTKVLTHVVVNSEEIGRSLVKGNEAWFPENKMVLIYNGVDTSRPMNKNQKLIERHDKELIIGNAGRLTEQKGQKYLIELGKLLKAHGMKFKILIAGEGELRASLLKSIEENHLKDEIKLLGHVDNMPAFFNSLDVFIFTSLFEGSANTLIETLQYGIPTIAWDTSSNPEIIIHGLTGFLAPLSDVKRMEEILTQELTPENLERIKGEALKIISEKFDYHKNLNILEKIVGQDE
jgi:glycosyltransferase involved in cell wall biosynthesis